MVTNGGGTLSLGKALKILGRIAKGRDYLGGFQKVGGQRNLA